MTFNYVDIAIAAIVIIMAIVGYSRGLFVSIINLARSIFGIVLCFFASSYLSPIIYDSVVENIARQTVSDKLGEVANIDVVASITETVNSLPQFIQGAVDLSAINNISSADTVDFVMASLVEPVASVILKIVVFVLVFIVFFLLTGIIVSLLKKKNKKDKSLIGKTNRLLGALFGFVKSIIVVCALVAVINFFIPYSNSENGIVQTASESVLFNAFNQYNPINFITRGA